MAIDKALYAAPQGLDALAQPESELDIVIEGEGTPPSIKINDDGSVEIELDGGKPGEEGPEEGFDENLAENMDESELMSLATDLLGHVDTDRASRKEWTDSFVRGLEVLGLKYEERSEPWEGACGVYSSVLAEAAIRFQAETMAETFPAAGPVRTKILGKETPEKLESAERVRNDMNYQLTERMVEYRSEHERMLWSLGLAGSAFKKVYYDPSVGRQMSVFIPAEDVLVPYGASHIETADRVTHIMRKTKNEVKRLQATGFYRELDLGEPIAFHTDIEEKKAREGGYSLTEDNRYTLYEIHANLVIPGVDGGDDEDALAKPYVVTVERGTQNILSIRRNWKEDDELHLKDNFFVHYIYIPGFGFYGLGLLHVIGGYSRAGTSIIRQLVDAGTLANLPGGLKSRGLRVKGDDTPISPGEWRDVDVPSGAIRDNILPLPYKEPSQTLLTLLNQLTDEGRRLGAISDMNISDMSAQAPVGTTLALLERTLRPMAAVQARVHFAMKQEFKLLKNIIADYTPKSYDYEPDTGAPQVKKSDYDNVDVIPVSDPNASTMAQRVVQYQAAFQMSQSAPQIYDQVYLHRQMLEVLGIKNADKIVPMPDDQKPRDPVSENMSVLAGKPLKAFLNQDHQAHITTHMTFMQDPMVAQMIGQNPMAQQMMSALQAHVAEHAGFLYRKQIEEQLGVTLPPPDEEMNPEIENLLSQVMAQAGQQLTQIHQQQAAQQQAQAQAQDPMFQLQQQEVATKQQEVQRKAAKDQQDAQIAQAKLQLEAMKVMGTNQLNQARAQLDASRAASQERTSQQKSQMDVAKMVMDAHRASQTKNEVPRAKKD